MFYCRISQQNDFVHSNAELEHCIAERSIILLSTAEGTLQNIPWKCLSTKVIFLNTGQKGHSTSPYCMQNFNIPFQNITFLNILCSVSNDESKMSLYIRRLHPELECSIPEHFIAYSSSPQRYRKMSFHIITFHADLKHSIPFQNIPFQSIPLQKVLFQKISQTVSL